MRFTTLALGLVVLAGCSGGSEDGATELLASYQGELDELIEATDAYVSAAATAADVDTVTDLQTDYDEAADHALEGLDHALEDLEGCDHMGDGAAQVLDAQATVQEMHEALHDLLGAHELHTDVADCQALATTHAQAMADATDSMAAHEDAWGGMTCEHHDDHHAE